MKWVALLLFCAIVGPLANWLRRNPQKSPIVWSLLGFLPFVLFPLHLLMAVISHNFWPGYVRGAEITLIDSVALSLFLSLPTPGQRLPFRTPMALYFGAVVLSSILAASPMDALFYPWQLLRMFLVYLVVVRGCANPFVVPALLRGFRIGLFMEAGLMLLQRIGGLVQADGTFNGHNYAGIISHYLVFPNFALALAGHDGYVPILSVIAGIMMEVLTTSRATLGLAAVGFTLLFAISAARRMTSRKTKILAIGALAIVSVAPVVVASFEKRFAAEGDLANFDERAAFEKSASMILSDYPLGVGPNHYAVVAALEGYNLKAGVPQVAGENDAFVHNVYWLVAAETGYLGLITFAIVLICPLVVAFRCGWSNRRDVRGDLLIGIGVALLVVYLHCFFEWVFLGSEGQYIFAMQVGIIGGLAQGLGYWKYR